MKMPALVAICILVLLSCSASAQHKLEAEFGNWLVFIDQKNIKEVCFTVSEPVAKNIQAQYRSSPHITINRVKKFHYEFRAYSGFKFSNDIVSLSIDGLYNFKLSPIEMEAWPYNEMVDNEILKYAPKGKKLIITSKNTKSELIIDEYSLDGLSKALVFMEKACK